MGLLDKVKAQAKEAVEMAQEAGKKGQAKLEEAQAKRKVDALFHDLGAAVYAERSGKPYEADIEALISEISALEAEHGDGVVTAEPAAGDGAASGTAGGSFGLDDV